jgi:beta-N-acetylhexosaminidase
MKKLLTRHIACAATVCCIAIMGLAPACSSTEVADQQLRRNIGDTIIVGFFGTKNTDPGFLQITQNLERGTIGGVLFLGRNISSRADLEAMVRSIRTCKCKTIPLIAIDEEGGVVERLGVHAGYRHTPSAAELGTSNETQARTEYGLLSRKVSEVGFNLNLAPVVDVNKNRSNPVIGMLDRSFSDDPKVVSRYASIFIEEHHKRGILTALKHFPGHGSSAQDSHRSVANVQTSWSTEELHPYRSLIKKGMVDSILVGHLANETKWGGVATQAGAHAINRMLRQQLKFDGVVLSDDLAMDAVNSSNAPLSRIVISAIQAGIDMVIVSRIDSRDESIDTGAYVNSAIFNAVKSGKLERSSIALSSSRVRSLKERLKGTTAKLKRK